jgi:hypothetical protein
MRQLQRILEDPLSMSDQHNDLAREAGVAVAKIVPPVAVWTLTLNNVLAALSILYVVLQTAYLVWKWRRDLKRGPA